MARVVPAFPLLAAVSRRRRGVAFLAALTISVAGLPALGGTGSAAEPTSTAVAAPVTEEVPSGEVNPAPEHVVAPMPDAHGEVVEWRTEFSSTFVDSAGGY